VTQFEILGWAFIAEIPADDEQLQAFAAAPPPALRNPAWPPPRAPCVAGLGPAIHEIMPTDRTDLPNSDCW
jgi:hypothetical protein